MICENSTRNHDIEYTLQNPIFKSTKKTSNICYLRQEFFWLSWTPQSAWWLPSTSFPQWGGGTQGHPQTPISAPPGGSQHPSPTNTTLGVPPMPEPPPLLFQASLYFIRNRGAGGAFFYRLIKIWIFYSCESNLTNCEHGVQTPRIHSRISPQTTCGFRGSGFPE